MIERDGEVSVKRQAQLLDLSRSSVYYVARGLPERDLRLMRILDELHLKWPFYGARKLTRELQNQGHEVGRRHVTTLMRRMGMETIYRKPRTSIPARLSAVYPYLLTGLKIERPNHVWAADLTYLPMAHGFQYLVAIIDVGSRKTLSWRVSNTMTPDFCVEALQEALGKYGKPEIFNTDQGSQGDFQRSSQHLAIGGVAWDDQRVGLQSGLDVRRCGRQVGRASTSGMPSRRSGRALRRELQVRMRHWRAACRSRLARAGSGRPVGWHRSVWLRSRDDICRSVSVRSWRC
jgi:putative transposase